MNRRSFLGGTCAGVIATLAGATPRMRAQSASGPLQINQPLPSGVITMDGDWYRPVRTTFKPGATRQLTSEDIVAIERQVACPCPCSHDVFTCRTVDASCTYAPLIHRDILALAQGGYAADEILALLRESYGESILITPSFRGLSAVAWLVPLAALIVGAAKITNTLKTWQLDTRHALQQTPLDGDISPDERAQVDRDLRESTP